MEGKFYRKKSANHPHTNMAKAAVNMMTRTCAEDLAREGIFMNSVDTVCFHFALFVTEKTLNSLLCGILGLDQRREPSRCGVTHCQRTQFPG